MKHKFISKRYWKNKATAMGATDKLGSDFKDLIDFSLGDPDLITDDYIIDNAFKDAKAGHTKYTNFSGDLDLKSAIQRMYVEDYDLQIEEDEIFITASGCLAMYLALEAILDDEDEVILHAPCFTPYFQQVELARGIPVVLPTYEDEDFQIHPERLEKLITSRTKAIIVNTPTNPTGNNFTEETLREISRIAIDHDLIVIADEIYTAYTFDNKFIPIISFPGMRERTITINSFSKNFIMTGWRVGNIIAPKFITETIQVINENVVFTAPSISQRAGIYAIEKRHELQDKFVKIYKERMYYAAKRIEKIPNMSVLKPKGTFYLFINIKETGKTSEEVCQILLTQGHILTIPGNAFGDCGEGYIRLACNISMEDLKEAFDRIEKIEMFQ